MTGDGHRRVVPGIAVLIAVGGVAWAIGRLIPGAPPLVVAIVLGALIANGVGVPEWAKPGLARYKLVLETAIVLLGAGVTLSAIVAAGPRLLALVLGVVIFGILVVELLARLSGLPSTTGSLLAAGSSVCGVSAVAAVGAACNLRSTVIAHAAATIVLFDALGLVVMPILGSVLGLEARPYGVWVGLTMFSTGPVTAAGFAHSPAAGEWATVTKLARNTLIGFVAIAYSLHYTSATSESSTGPSNGGLLASIAGWGSRVAAGAPPFLVGFLLLALISNAGVLPEGARASISTASSTLFLLAFAGLGFELRWERVRATGTTPVLVVGTYAIVVGTATYVAVTAVL